MKTLRFIVAAGLFIALVVAAELLNTGPGYYPSVVVDIPADLHITLVRRPRATLESCEASASGSAA